MENVGGDLVRDLPGVRHGLDRGLDGGLGGLEENHGFLRMAFG